MLVSCGECRREISDRAQACPHCGAPQQALERASAKVETEATHRGLKNQMIYAFLCIVAGLFGAMATQGPTSGIWALVMVAGLLWWIGARIAAWYRNG